MTHEEIQRAKSELLGSAYSAYVVGFKTKCIKVIEVTDPKAALTAGKRYYTIPCPQPFYPQHRTDCFILDNNDRPYRLHVIEYH